MGPLRGVALLEEVTSLGGRGYEEGTGIPALPLSLFASWQPSCKHLCCAPCLEVLLLHRPTENGLKSLKPQAKINFFLLIDCLPGVFCHIDRKMTNTLSLHSCEAIRAYWARNVCTTINILCF